jgi:hypothetical protein
MADMKVTPVYLAKEMGIRPQMIFNWIKQGAPHYILGGKKFVTKKELMEWRDGKKEKREQKPETHDWYGAAISEELYSMLVNFKPHRIKSDCSNCEVEVEFVVDITYTDKVSENLVHAYCSQCGLNHRYQENIPNDVCLMVLKGEKELWFPVETTYEWQFKGIPPEEVERRKLKIEEEAEDARDSERVSEGIMA